ncbi:MAG: hypothetical protein E7642_08520 [Ruminococcaceae bacterium]|nr:hypothetical protein [Oscillospiraceae bacterium]
MSTRSISADYISAALGELDDRIFAEAYLTDSAEKMKELIRKERGEKLRSAFCVRNLKRVGALAACIAVCVAIAAAVPFAVNVAKHVWNIGNDIQIFPPATDSTNGTLVPPSDDIVIDGIGKLNYYSALSIFSDSFEDSSLGNIASPDGSLGSSFDEDGIFTVTEASFMRIYVSEGSFLAEKLGTGTVDVAISKNNIADMMTFKCGDRFYSCASTDGDGCFYSSNTVEGFEVYFGDDEKGYKFELAYDGGKVTGIRATALGNSGGEETLMSAVEDSAKFFTGKVSFTVSSVENFINGVSDGAAIKIPNEDKNCTHTYGEWTDAEDMRCDEKGSIERICLLCGYAESKTVVGTHSFGSDGKCIYCTMPTPTNDLIFEAVNDSYCTVSIGVNKSEIIAIPESYKGLPVKVIESFSDYVSGNSTLKEIYIPASVTEISEAAFASARELRIVHIAEGSQLEKIGNEAFYMCRKLEKIELENCEGNLKSIGYRAFSYCQNLKSIYIPEGVTEILSNAFSDCELLSSVYYPSTVTSVQPYVFAQCHSLKNIDFMSNSDTIGAFMFNNCSGLDVIRVPKEIKHIYEYAFASSSATRIELPSDIVEMGASVFSDCKSLETVVWSDSINIIPSSTFRFCNALKSVENIFHITEISFNAFDDCNALQIIDLTGTKITKIDDNAFSDCNRLEEIKLPETLKVLGSNVFGYCVSLEAIELPASVTDMGYGAFNNCSSLKRIDLSHVKQIESMMMFENCTLLTEVLLPDTFDKVGGSMFRGCVSLQSIVLPSTVYKIERLAFYECPSLINVTLDVDSPWYYLDPEQKYIPDSDTSSPAALANALANTYAEMEWQRVV